MRSTPSALVCWGADVAIELCEAGLWLRLGMLALLGSVGHTPGLVAQPPGLLDLTVEAGTDFRLRFPEK
jgi:hypothetical protein